MLQGDKEMKKVDQKVLSLTFECANEIRALLLRYDLSNSAKYACLVKCAIEVAERELPASRIADQFIHAAKYVVGEEHGMNPNVTH